MVIWGLGFGIEFGIRIWGLGLRIVIGDFSSKLGIVARKWGLGIRDWEFGIGDLGAGRLRSLEAGGLGGVRMVYFLQRGSPAGPAAR